MTPWTYVVSCTVTKPSNFVRNFHGGDFVTCGQLLTLVGPVELHPLQLEDGVLVPGVAGPGVLVEDVVAREGVLRPGEVELGHQPQPDGHGVLSVALLVTGVQI